jgi:hypothetical protein
MTKPPRSNLTPDPYPWAQKQALDGKQGSPESEDLDDAQAAGRQTCGAYVVKKLEGPSLSLAVMLVQ